MDGCRLFERIFLQTKGVASNKLTSDPVKIVKIFSRGLNFVYSRAVKPCDTGLTKVSADTPKKGQICS